MTHSYSRPLDTNEAVEQFLLEALKFKHPKFDKIVSMIVDGEMGKNKIAKQQETLDSPLMRAGAYRDDSKRWQLRERIISELFTQKRLNDDDRIKLGVGGALPLKKVKTQSIAFILTGLPASGKSSVASKIADEYSATILDSDFAKRKLPEYKNHYYGATLVHQESSEITFGFKPGKNPNKVKSLSERCIEAKQNLVIPRIGQNPASILDLTNALRKQKYKVHLILIAVSKQQATVRAIARYYKSKRYVPLGLIFDLYGNDPSHSYYYLRSKHTDLFESFGVIANQSQPPKYTDVIGKSPVTKYLYENKILTLP